jgi:phosphatidylglycerophosphate synthase
MVNARRLVNTLSLSRIGMGLLFVLSFQRRAALLELSLGVCVIAVATDVLDGYFARRLRVASIDGRLWDSLGDKAFYIATIVAFNAQGFLGPLISWALIVREVALYITRVLFIQNLPRVEQIRIFTNWHGYFMYLTIILGLLRMYGEIHGRALAISPYMHASAYASLMFGVVSIVHFIKLQ